MIKAIKTNLKWKRRTLEYEKLCLEHPLRYLFLEITRKCNLNCVYCGSDCTPDYPADELSAKQWIKIIDQIAQDFDPAKVMVAVTGGEPLMKDGIFDIFHELHKNKFFFGMVTNGQLVTEEKAKKIVETGIGSISISMDAPPEINDKLRGEGCSAKVIKAVENLKNAGFKGKLEIISTLTKPAVEHLEEMRKFIAKIKVPLWRVAPVMPIGRAAENKELIPDERDLKTILDFIVKSRKDRFIPKPEFGEEGYLGDKYENEVRPYLHQCRAGITVAGIRCDGRIGACPELADEFLQGDISKERFSMVWNEKYQIFRDRSWTKKDKCKNCDAYNRCNGGSLHLYPGCSSGFSRCFYLMLNKAC